MTANPPSRLLRHAVPIALLLVAFTLRLYRLGDQNVWWDEGLAIWAVRKSLAGATLWTASDVHPPLFFWGLWLWVRLVGQSELAARYLTLACGVLSCALGFALARRLAGHSAGVLALALLAVARLEVWWSMELRMYMLAGALVLVASNSGLNIGLGERIRGLQGLWRRDGEVGGVGERRSRWAGWLGGYGVYVAAAVGALYSVYLTVVALVGLNVVVGVGVLVGRVSWRAWRGWLVAQGVVVALFVPWLLVAVPRMRSWTTVEQPASLGFVSRLWATLLATGVSTDLEAVGRAVAVFWLAALVVPAVWLGYRAVAAGDVTRGRRGAGLAVWAVAALLVLGLPPLAVWAATQPRAIFYAPRVEARYFVPFAGLAYVLVGCLLAAVWRRARVAGMALTAVVLAVMLLSLPRHYRDRRLRDELQSLVLAIWTQAEPGDAVVLVSGSRYPLFRYYYDQPWRRALKGMTDCTPRRGDPATSSSRPEVFELPDRGSESVDRVDWEGRLERIAGAHDRVWLVEVESQLQDPEDRIEQWLTSHRTRVLSESYGPNALHLYSRRAEPPRATAVSGAMPGMHCVTADDGSPGDAFGLPVDTFLPGDEANLTLFFRSRPPEAESIALLADGSPVPVWSGVVPLPQGDGPTRARVGIPIGARFPRGDYAVWRLGERPRHLGRLHVRGTAPSLAEVVSLEGADFGFTRLRRFAVERRSVRAGASLAVDLYWQADPASPWPEAAPVVFVHLVGPPRSGGGDPVWAGQDGPPSSGAWTRPPGWAGEVFDRHVLTLDPAAPPGEYTVEVGLYDPSTGERYPVSGADADPESRRVILGTVTVR